MKERYSGFQLAKDVYSETDKKFQHNVVAKDPVLNEHIIWEAQKKCYENRKEDIKKNLGK